MKTASQAMVDAMFGDSQHRNPSPPRKLPRSGSAEKALDGAMDEALREESGLSDLSESTIQNEFFGTRSGSVEMRKAEKEESLLSDSSEATIRD